MRDSVGACVKERLRGREIERERKRGRGCVREDVCDRDGDGCCVSV